MYIAQIFDPLGLVGRTITTTKSSTQTWLNPLVHSGGIIRVGDRLRNAALSDKIKHPILLSTKHPLAALLASYS